MDKEHQGRQYIHPHLLKLIDESEGMKWLFVENLKEGDILEVQTQNTLYTMKIIDPVGHRVIVNSNGCHITEEIEGSVGGSSLTGTGTMIKIGGIAVGLRLILFMKGIGELILSSTKEVRVNGIKLLPSEKIIPFPKKS